MSAKGRQDFGQAVGTAASMAVQNRILPRDVNDHIHELQQTLLRDDCYLPWVTQEFGPLTVESRLIASQGDPEPVRDGTSRQVDDDPHAWFARPGDHVAYIFPESTDVKEVSLALDSDLKRDIYYSWNEYPVEMDGDPVQQLGRLRQQPVFV